MNYLAHYGVLGMHWGVRRYQNKDGSLTSAGKIRLKGAKRKQNLIKTQLGIDVDKKIFMKPDKDSSKEVNLKKGQNVYHVTPLEFKKLREGQDLFVSATNKDRDLYKSFLTMQMRKKGWGKDTPISEVSFRLKQDLHSPSNKQQKKIFNEVYKTNKKIFDSDMKRFKEKGSGNSTEPYDVFIKTLDKKHQSKKIFYDALRKHGYNAVLDQHDVTDSWMQASRPLIIMDALNTIGDMKVKNVTNKDIKRSLKRLGYI